MFTSELYIYIYTYTYIYIYIHLFQSKSKYAACQILNPAWHLGPQQIILRSLVLAYLYIFQYKNASKNPRI